MPKITYLLGAGASSEALPTIAKGPKGSNGGLSYELERYTHHLYVNVSPDRDLKANELPVSELSQKSVAFKTPDLYAKYLLETGDEINYKRLKHFLSHYFTNAQKPYTNSPEQKGLLDFRALQFLITLTNNKRLPENIKIISWNYDSQIEMAAEQLLLDHDKGFACWPNTPTPEYDKDLFLLHLNGVAGFQYSKRDLRLQLDRFFSLDKNIEPLLSFAWEEEGTGMSSFLNYRLKYLNQIMLGTDILVVIGYSFPFFNRKFDNIIMQAMKINPRKKIYYQDPFRSGEFLYDQFGLDKGITIKHIEDCSQYFIPYEL